MGEPQDNRPPLKLDYSAPDDERRQELERQRQADAEYDRRLSLEQFEWPSLSRRDRWLALILLILACVYVFLVAGLSVEPDLAERIIYSALLILFAVYALCEWRKFRS